MSLPDRLIARIMNLNAPVAKQAWCHSNPFSFLFCLHAEKERSVQKRDQQDLTAPIFRHTQLKINNTAWIAQW